jgi:hypothetical protein
MGGREEAAAAAHIGSPRCCPPSGATREKRAGRRGRGRRGRHHTLLLARANVAECGAQDRTVKQGLSEAPTKACASDGPGARTAAERHASSQQTASGLRVSRVSTVSKQASVSRG